MVIAELKSKTIFLDTAPLIYFIDGHSGYQPILNELFKANDNGLFTFITSTITLLEVLVGPLRAGRQDIVTQYQTLLTNSTNIDILEITVGIASIAAVLRAKYNLKTPDSIQLATSIEYDADYFLTNDLKLKNVSNIKVITLSDLQ